LICLVEPEAREEDLIREVSVERGRDVAEHAEVAIHELGDPARVIDRTGARAPGDVQRALGEAEVLLDVDQEQMHARFGGGARSDRVLRTPRGRGGRELGGIRPVAPVSGVLRIAVNQSGLRPQPKIDLNRG